MSYYLDWDIVGFYDSKILLLRNGLSAKDCVFLDIEILRSEIRSLGHHMNIHNINEPPKNYDRDMAKCINPNRIRGIDRTHNFTKKYPLGSIHLLMYLLETKYPSLVKIKKEGLGALFFADGVWKILFKYTNNVMDWFDYLKTDRDSAWWVGLKKSSVIDLIEEINILLRKFRELNDNKNWYGHVDISDFVNQKHLMINALKLLGDMTGWGYNIKRWSLGNLKKYNFTKNIYEGSGNNAVVLKIFRKNPLSLAMTEGTTIQYTLEEPDKLP